MTKFEPFQALKLIARGSQHLHTRRQRWRRGGVRRYITHLSPETRSMFDMGGNMGNETQAVSFPTKFENGGERACDEM